MCEWNPELDQPATRLGEVVTGCPNEATVVVGANGQYHLCESCSKLPRFKRFSKRSFSKGKP